MDYPYGTPVVYEDDNGEEAPLAFITTKDGGSRADLAVMTQDSEWELHIDVPRSVDGGRNTWRSLVETD